MKNKLFMTLCELNITIKKNNQLLSIFFGGLICFFSYAWIAAIQAGKGITTDLIAHSTLLPKLESDGVLYSLWYLLQKLIVLGNYDQNVLIASGYLLLGMLFFFKGAMIACLLSQVSKNFFSGIFVSSLIFLAAPIIIPGYIKLSPGFGISTMYIGDITPNTIHSATQHIANIFSIPCVLFFGLYISNPTNWRLLISVLFTFLAVAAKPGIAPGILVAWVMGSFYLYKIHALSKLRICTLFFVILVILSFVLWIKKGMLSGSWMDTNSQINPLATWNFYSAYPWVDLVRSWLFPAVATGALFFLKGGDQQSKILLSVSWTIAIVSLIPFILLSEVKDTTLVYPGNFIWGSIAATSALYFISAYVLMDKEIKVYIIPLLVLFWSAYSGIIYFNTFSITKNYL
jgi:hypothetical protein